MPAPAHRLRAVALTATLSLTMAVAGALPSPASASSTAAAASGTAADAAPFSTIAKRAIASAPTNVRAQALDRALRVRWAAPASNGGQTITAYRVQISRNGTTWHGAGVVDGSKRSIVVDSLVNGRLYYVRAAAVNASGLGTWSAPTTVRLQIVHDIRPGAFHTCALMVEDRTVRCWGFNATGQLGDGSQDDSPAPVEVVGLTGVRQLAVGEAHACALVAGGRVRCWGADTFGQIGDGADGNDDQLTPVLLPLTNVVAIAAREINTCAIRSDRTVWCWGSDTFGQVGDGPVVTGDHPSPTQVTGITNARSIAVGAYYACAVLQSGPTKCWGKNDDGQLGDGTTDQREAPVTVTGLTDAVQVAGGSSSTCARRSNGLVACWGDNTSGQIGDGTNDDRPAPTRVEQLNQATDITVGFEYACAQRGPDGLRCWGKNDVGQLGDGSQDDRPTRVVVPGTVGAHHVRTGRNHTCAVRSSAQVACWGDNTFAQIGTGAATGPVLTPTRVVGLG